MKWANTYLIDFVPQENEFAMKLAQNRICNMDIADEWQKVTIGGESQYFNQAQEETLARYNGKQIPLFINEEIQIRSNFSYLFD